MEFQVGGLSFPVLVFLEGHSVEEIVVHFPFHGVQVDFGFRPFFEVLSEVFISVKVEEFNDVVIGSIIIMINIGPWIASILQSGTGQTTAEVVGTATISQLIEGS